MPCDLVLVEPYKREGEAENHRSGAAGQNVVLYPTDPISVGQRTTQLPNAVFAALFHPASRNCPVLAPGTGILLNPNWQCSRWLFAGQPCNAYLHLKNFFVDFAR